MTTNDTDTDQRHSAGAAPTPLFTPTLVDRAITWATTHFGITSEAAESAVAVLADVLTDPLFGDATAPGPVLDLDADALPAHYGPGDVLTGIAAQLGYRLTTAATTVPVTVRRLDVDVRRWVTVGRFPIPAPDMDSVISVITWRKNILAAWVRDFLTAAHAPTHTYEVYAELPNKLPNSAYSMTWIADHGTGTRTAHVAYTSTGFQLDTFLEGAPCSLCKPRLDHHEGEWVYSNTLGPACLHAAAHAKLQAGDGYVIRVEVPDTGDTLDMEMAALAEADKVDAGERNTASEQVLERWLELGRENPWIAAATDPPFTRRSFRACRSVAELKARLTFCMWELGAAFYYKDLCFINQVDGGDRWLTIRHGIAFASTTFAPSIARGEFEALIERLLTATEQQCRDLSY